MRILVIGGTGFIGGVVTRQLVQAGHSVAVIRRGAEPVEGATTTIQADHRRLEEVRDRIAGVQPEVAIDAILSSGHQAERTVRVLAGVAGRLVVLSSQDVYRATSILHGLEPGPPEPVPLTEESALRSRLQPYPPSVLDRLRVVFSWLEDDYDKILVERAAGADPRLPATLLRLPMVYGPGDPLHRPYPIIKRVDDGRHTLVLSERVARWRGSRGYVENVAAAIVAAAVSPQAAGRVYNVGNVVMSELEWTGAVAAAAGFAGTIAIVSDDRAPAHLDLPGNLEQHWVTSDGRIRNDLSYDDPVGFRDGLERTIAWERSHPPATIDPAQFDYAAEDAALR
jgi:nucleoside-diphosphate-sugar epimerase